jgi:hypothetical protein
MYSAGSTRGIHNVPANRSRTERWRDCLWQVYERAGALEITVSSPPDDRGGHGPDLVWRVRLLGLSESEIQVEQPSAAGHTIPIEPGVRLVAAMSIGQNRWMFHTHALPAGVRGAGGSDTRPAPLRLAMPQAVERCQRRNFYRISTAELLLPMVECWPLFEPTSAIAAEVANRAQILDLLRLRREGSLAISEEGAEPIVLPEVGPRFNARLMNLGGGGAGLLIDRSDSAALERSRFLWLRINLAPQIPLPIGVTGRLVHTHIDSGQNLYGGIAFDWSFNAGHRDFVIDQIADYLAMLQHRQILAA